MMLLNWFKSLKLPWKIVTIVVATSILYSGYISVKLARLHYQRVKWIKENIELIHEEKLQNQKKTDSVIDKGKTVTKKAVIQNRAIDKKLQDDKDNIDNSDYTDAKLDSLLARY